MTNREKGSATVPCPSCGTDLPVVEQADGSVAGKTCEKCFPAPKKSEIASASKEAREQGTTTTKEKS